MSPTLVLAETQINTDNVTPGVLGFIVVAAVGLVLYFLMKNMLGKLSAVRGKEFGDSGTTGSGTEGAPPKGEPSEGKPGDNGSTDVPVSGEANDGNGSDSAS